MRQKKIGTLLLACVAGVGASFGAVYQDDFSTATQQLVAVSTELTYSDVILAETPTDLNWWGRNLAGNMWAIQSTNGNPLAWASKNNYSQANSSAIYAVIQNDGSLDGVHNLAFDLRYNKGQVAMRVWGIDNSSVWSNSFTTSSGSGAFGSENSLNYAGGGVSTNDAVSLLKMASRSGEITPDINWQRVVTQVDFGTGLDWIVIGFAQGSTSDGSEPNVGIDNFVLSSDPLLLPPITVSAVANITELDTIDVSWEGAVSAETYNLYRSTTSGSNYTAIATGLTTNVYADAGLVNGTWYYYAVESVSNGVSSALSSEGTARPGADFDAPAAPLGLSASALSHWEIGLSWSASPESDLASYTVYRSQTSGSDYVAIASNLISNSYIDDYVVEQETYFYVVTASDLVGNESDFSDESSAASLINTKIGDIVWGTLGGYVDLDNDGPNNIGREIDYVFQMADVTDTNILYDVAVRMSCNTNEAVREAGGGLGVGNNFIYSNQYVSVSLVGVYERATTGLADTGIRISNRPISSSAVVVAGAALSLQSYEEQTPGNLIYQEMGMTNFTWTGTLVDDGTPESKLDSLKKTFFRVATGGLPSGFESWASTWGVNIGVETDDYDGDGFSNFYEYALNGDPTNPLVSGTLPSIQNANGSLYFTHLERKNDPQLTYVVESTGNLVVPSWADAGATVVGTDESGANYNVVTNQISTSANQSFIRLNISYE